jgi:hypothetical protein
MKSGNEITIFTILLQFQWPRTHAKSEELTKCMEDQLDQANKSIGWMPWHQEPKKDVVSCEKPWGAASRL